MTILQQQRNKGLTTLNGIGSQGREALTMPAGYDAWKTDPGPAYADVPPPEGERADIEEPTVDEVWHPARGEYVTTVTFDSGSKFTILQATAGAFVGDYEIHGPGGLFRDGFTSPEKAVEWLCDPERWDW